MSYELKFTSQFKKDYKKLRNSSVKISKVNSVLEILMEQGVEGIPKVMKPHKLIGNWKGALECHIEGDLLLIWIQEENPNIIILTRLGSHSELFE